MVHHGAAPDIVAQVVFDRVAGLDQHQIEPDAEVIGQEPGQVHVDALRPGEAVGRERGEIGIDPDLSRPLARI